MYEITHVQVIIIIISDLMIEYNTRHVRNDSHVNQVN